MVGHEPRNKFGRGALRIIIGIEDFFQLFTVSAGLLHSLKWTWKRFGLPECSLLLSSLTLVSLFSLSSLLPLLSSFYHFIFFSISIIPEMVRIGRIVVSIYMISSGITYIIDKKNKYIYLPSITTHANSMATKMGRLAWKLSGHSCSVGYSGRNWQLDNPKHVSRKAAKITTAEMLNDKTFVYQLVSKPIGGKHRVRDIQNMASNLVET